MKYILCALLGYLVGSINPSFFFGKLNGLDIRKKGSGNAGATNVMLLFGKMTGFICAMLDIAKAFLVVLLADALFPHFKHTYAVTAVFCVVGHIFPFYMGFKGGKGLACLGGMILAYDWRVLLIMLGLEFVVAFATNYLCFVPISASIAFPFVYWAMSRDLAGAVLLLIPAVIMFYRHLENLRRIRTGTEMHFSYLWKPEKEMQRLKDNLDEDEDAVTAHFSVK